MLGPVQQSANKDYLALQRRGFLLERRLRGPITGQYAIESTQELPFRLIAATMPAVNKTKASAVGKAPVQKSSSLANPKKRKMDAGQQKYYAVRCGVTPGVYLTWAECQANTAGFAGANC